MKVIDLIKNNKGTAFSFEILPPIKGNSIQKVYKVIDKLREFDPKYINITSHHSEYIYKTLPDGSFQKVNIRKRPGSVAIASAIQNKYGITAVPHIICKGFSKDETEYALIDLNFLGVYDLLLLRGDIKTIEKSEDTSLYHEHAQLFAGQNGVGTFSLALAYAQYLNCTNRTDNDSCGHCPSCLKYEALAHPDLHFVFPIVLKKDKGKEVCDDYLTEWRTFLKDRPYFTFDEWLDCIDAGNSQAIIYSKESDEIIRKVSLKIYEAKYRILLVWLPEKLHPVCANKLLKVIEEPPQNTVILLISETPDLILGTIQSRAQRINIHA